MYNANIMYMHILAKIDIFGVGLSQISGGFQTIDNDNKNKISYSFMFYLLFIAAPPTCK